MDLLDVKILIYTIVSFSSILNRCNYIMLWIPFLLVLKSSKRSHNFSLIRWGWTWYTPPSYIFFLKNTFVTAILRTGFLKSICNDYFFKLFRYKISFVYSRRFSKRPQDIFDCHWLSFLPFMMYISNSVIEKPSGM